MTKHYCLTIWSLRTSHGWLVSIPVAYCGDPGIIYLCPDVGCPESRQYVEKYLCNTAIQGHCLNNLRQGLVQLCGPHATDRHGRAHRVPFADARAWRTPKNWLTVVLTVVFLELELGKAKECVLWATRVILLQYRENACFWYFLALSWLSQLSLMFFFVLQTR